MSPSKNKTSSENQAPAVVVQKHKKIPVFSQVDLLILGGIVVVLLVTGYRLWSVTRPTKSAQVSAPTATPVVVPTLSLHQDHERQGPDITVDPDQIGKANPFQ